MDNLKISKEEMDAIIKELQRSPGSLAESRDIDMMQGRYPKPTPTPSPSSTMSPEDKMMLDKLFQMKGRTPSSVTPYDKAYPMPSKLNFSDEDVQDMLKSNEFVPPFTQPTPSESKINRSPDSDINFMEAYNPQLNEKTPLSNEELINMMRENQSYLPQDKNLDNEPVLPFNNIRGTINRSR